MAGIIGRGAMDARQKLPPPVPSYTPAGSGRRMSPDDTADKDRADPDDAKSWELELEEMAREAGPALRDDIARLVAVLEEAGEPLGTTEASGRMRKAGATSAWVVVYMTALKEGAVWTPETGMVSIPPKRRPGTSPEVRAMRMAFEKARGLGMISHTDERLVLTVRGDGAPLTPAELERAERWVNRCNALGSPEVFAMYARCREGKVTQEELEEYTRGVAAQADAQPLVHAQRAARKKDDTAHKDSFSRRRSP